MSRDSPLCSTARSHFYLRTVFLCEFEPYAKIIYLTRYQYRLSVAQVGLIDKKTFGRKSREAVPLSFFTPRRVSKRFLLTVNASKVLLATI
jgi:hypothetical protein